MTIDTTALRGNHCLNARSSIQSIDFKHSKFSQPVCMLLNHKGMIFLRKDVLRYQMRLQNVKEFHQNQLLGKKKKKRLSVKLFGFGFSSKRFLPSVAMFSLEISSPKIFPKNPELLYLGYATTKALGIFKFLLAERKKKSIKPYFLPPLIKALAGINNHF